MRDNDELRSLVDARGLSGGLVQFEIAKEFRFSAGHRLLGMPDGHKCGRLHGHNYRVIVKARASQLDGSGFVNDFADFNPLRDWLDDNWDHCLLLHVDDPIIPALDDAGETFVFTNWNPTAENMAACLLALAHDLGLTTVSSVVVWETEKCYAECSLLPQAPDATTTLSALASAVSREFSYQQPVVTAWPGV